MEIKIYNGNIYVEMDKEELKEVPKNSQTVILFSERLINLSEILNDKKQSEVFKLINLPEELKKVLKEHYNDQDFSDVCDGWATFIEYIESDTSIKEEFLSKLSTYIVSKISVSKDSDFSCVATQIKNNFKGSVVKDINITKSPLIVFQDKNAYMMQFTKLSGISSIEDCLKSHMERVEVLYKSKIDAISSDYASTLALKDQEISRLKTVSFGETLRMLKNLLNSVSSYNYTLSSNGEDILLVPKSECIVKAETISIHDSGRKKVFELDPTEKEVFFIKNPIIKIGTNSRGDATQFYVRRVTTESMTTIFHPHVDTSCNDICVGNYNGAKITNRTINGLFTTMKSLNPSSMYTHSFNSSEQRAISTHGLEKILKTDSILKELNDNSRGLSSLTLYKDLLVKMDKLTNMIKKYKEKMNEPSTASAKTEDLLWSTGGEEEDD